MMMRIFDRHSIHKTENTEQFHRNRTQNRVRCIYVYFSVKVATKCHNVWNKETLEVFEVLTGARVRARKYAQ